MSSSGQYDELYNAVEKVLDAITEHVDGGNDIEKELWNSMKETGRIDFGLRVFRTFIEIYDGSDQTKKDRMDIKDEIQLLRKTVNRFNIGKMRVFPPHGEERPIYPHNHIADVLRTNEPSAPH